MALPGNRASEEIRDLSAPKAARWVGSFLRLHEDQVMHLWVADNVAAQTLL